MQTMKFQFGDFKQQVDLSDVDFVLRYEQAIAEYEEGIKGLNREVPPSAQLVQVCQLFFALFDRLFGEDSAKKMFGETKSVALCTKAFTQLLRAMHQYAGALQQEGEA